MKTINLQNIIEEQKLKAKNVALELFPENKYPKMALDRVLKGEALLDANQIAKLSEMIGVEIDKLYSNNWKVQPKPDGLIVFHTDGYRAELDVNAWVTKIYKNNSLYHETVIASKAIKLSEYIAQLNTIIAEN